MDPKRWGLSPLTWPPLAGQAGCMNSMISETNGSTARSRGGPRSCVPEPHLHGCRGGGHRRLVAVRADGRRPIAGLGARDSAGCCGARRVQCRGRGHAACSGAPHLCAGSPDPAGTSCLCRLQLRHLLDWCADKSDLPRLCRFGHHLRGASCPGCYDCALRPGRVSPTGVLSGGPDGCWWW